MDRTIKEWRVNRGYTQEELAGRIGVTTSTYNGWERYPESIKLGNILRICDALEVKPQDVLFFKGDSYLKYDKEEVK